MRQAAETLRTKLLTYPGTVPTFTATKEMITQLTDSFLKADFSSITHLEEAIRTYWTVLKGLPGQDAAIQEDITASIKEINLVFDEIRKAHSSDTLLSLIALLPSFVLHSATVDQIPNEVQIAQFVKDPETTSRGMLNLCRAAGLNVQTLSQLAAKDSSHRETYEDYYQGAISGGLNEFWTQETYLVQFRIETT